MPLYEYQCESCQHRFEKIRKFSDPPLEACPVCNGPVRKLFSSPAIQFKGSGWYINDYAKKSSTEPGGGKDKADSGGTDKGESGAGSDSNSKSDSSDSKSSDSKSSDSKSSSKSSDSKSSDSKSSDSKSTSTSDTSPKT